MRGQQARAGAGQRAVDAGQKTAAPFAVQSLDQFEIPARRPVDLHHRAFRQRRGAAMRGSLPFCVSSM